MLPAFTAAFLIHTDMQHSIPAVTPSLAEKPALAGVGWEEDSDCLEDDGVTESAGCAYG